MFTAESFHHITNGDVLMRHQKHTGKLEQVQVHQWSMKQQQQRNRLKSRLYVNTERKTKGFKRRTNSLNGLSFWAGPKVEVKLLQAERLQAHLDILFMSIFMWGIRRLWKQPQTAVKMSTLRLTPPTCYEGENLPQRLWTTKELQLYDRSLSLTL